MPDHSPPFVRIDREQGGGAEHFVVHAAEPRFTLELAAAGGRESAGSAVLKRLCVPNSWAGDYGRFAWLVADAQEFFHRSEAAGRPAGGSRGAVGGA